MIGLPDGVGAGRLVAVDQVEGFGIGLRPLMGQGHQGRVQIADHGIDGAVARRRLPEPLGEGDGLAMDRRRGQGRLLQGEAFDGLAQRVGEVPFAPVASPLAGQPGEPLAAILAGPASGGAEGEAPVAGHAGQRDPLFQGGAEELEPLEGQGTLGLREAVERRLRHRRERSSGTARTASQPARRRMNRLSAEWCQIAPKKPRQIPANLTAPAPVLGRLTADDKSRCRRPICCVAG